MGAIRKRTTRDLRKKTAVWPQRLRRSLWSTPLPGPKQEVCVLELARVCPSAKINYGIRLAISSYIGEEDATVPEVGPVGPVFVGLRARAKVAPG